MQKAQAKAQAQAQAKAKAKAKAGRKRLPGLRKSDGYMLHPFDAENGVRTSGLVAGRNLKSGHRHDRYATAYYGVAPSVFHALVERWQRLRPVDAAQNFTFVDVGAGMGRALLLASEMRFREVLGVELNPTLVRIARRNLSAWRRQGRQRSQARVLCADATEWKYPLGPCVLFLFNPFGATVMRRLLVHVARDFASRPGELDLLYINNEQEGVLEGRRGFARLFLGKVRRSRADAAADRAILANQPDGEYASAPYEDCSIWRWVGNGPDGPHVGG